MKERERARNQTDLATFLVDSSRSGGSTQSETGKQQVRMKEESPLKPEPQEIKLIEKKKSKGNLDCRNATQSGRY